MAAMKISLDSAMRARDVSQPRTTDEATAERTDAAKAVSKPGPGARPTPSALALGGRAAGGLAPATRADLASESAPERELQAEGPKDQQQANGPDGQQQAEGPGPWRVAGGRGRGRRRHSPSRRN